MISTTSRLTFLVGVCDCEFDELFPSMETGRLSWISECGVDLCLLAGRSLEDTLWLGGWMLFVVRAPVVILARGDMISNCSSSSSSSSRLMMFPGCVVLEDMGMFDVKCEVRRAASASRSLFSIALCLYARPIHAVLLRFLLFATLYGKDRGIVVHLLQEHN